MPTKRTLRSRGWSPSLSPYQISELLTGEICYPVRRGFEEAVETGRLLAESRGLLKQDRLWLAWLRAEFSWSRRHADRLIDLFKGQHKVRKLRTLPLTALTLLARAEPQVVAEVEREVESGVRPTVHQIRVITTRSTQRVKVPPPKPRTPEQREAEIRAFGIASRAILESRKIAIAYVRSNEPPLHADAVQACALRFRQLVNDVMRDLPSEQWSDLFDALREELSAIEEARRH